MTLAHVGLFFLGAPRLERDGAPVEVATRKALALIAYLAGTGITHSRDALAAMLWPESSQQRARASLRSTLSILKKTLGEAWLIADYHEVGLNWRTGIRVDVAEFRRLVRNVPAAPSALSNPSDKKPSLVEAVSLYQGDFLTGFTLPDSPAFDEWQYFEREGLRQDFAKALETIIADYQSVQAFEPAIPYARRWVALEPLHEPAHCRLMELYVQANQRAAALRQYHECKRILEEELGVQPDPGITALYERIRIEPVASSRQQRQPVDTTAAPPASRSNLPVRLTPFIGRAQELSELERLLANPDCRLLTLVGPGGIGKTRLAIETAKQQIDRFKQGVYYIDLTPLRSTQLLVPTITEALDFTWPGHNNPRQQLLSYLQSKEILLLLDNFEHLLEGIDLIVAILTYAPGLKIIVTSRENLDLEEEWLYPVPGLPYPADSTAENLTDYSSIRLFRQRASQIAPNFSFKMEAAEISRICQLVEGMPLGLELAATWVKTLSCAEIAQEIARNLDFLTTTRRNVSDRHRSLRAVFEHSWRLLTSGEQRVLAQLSVFRGGFIRETMIQVTGASLFDLHRLVNKSLLQRADNERYDVHELLRQFAAEKLQAEPALDAAARQRHAEYYGLFLQRKETFFDSDQEQEAIIEIRAEIQNIRAGWHWAASARNSELLDRYIESLHLFYEIVAWYREGKEVFEQAVAHLTGSSQVTAQVTPANDIILGKLLARLAEFCHDVGQAEQALQFAQKALSILDRSQDEAEIALAYKVLGVINYHQGAYLEAQQLLYQSLDTMPKTVSAGKIANIYLFLGAVTFALGEYAEAKRWQQTSLNIYETINKLWGIGHATRWLGATAEALEDYGEAQYRYQQSMIIFQKMNNLIAIALCRNNLGVLSQKLGDYDGAKEQHEQSLRLYQECDDQVKLARTLNYLGYVCSELSEYEEAQEYLRTALRMSVNIKSMPFVLQALSGIANLFIKVAALPQPNQLTSESQPVDSRLIKAFELLTIVTNHPATHQETRRQAQKQFTEIIARLPPEVINTLQERVKDERFETTYLAMISSGEPKVAILEEVEITEEIAPTEIKVSIKDLE